jgi:hypothetical protein
VKYAPLLNRKSPLVILLSEELLILLAIQDGPSSVEPVEEHFKQDLRLWKRRELAT